MLEDIGKLGPVEQTIASARQVAVFLYGHTGVLDLMRKFLGKDLVRSGVTRFATAYLNLKSLLDNKKELTKLFRSDELNEMGYLKKATGKKANKVVRSEGFWKNVDMAVNFFEPLANVLRRMDGDVPSMGFFHGLMLEAKKEIFERFDNDESRFKVVWDIIDKMWDNKLKTPLHLAGYYLNPYFYYPKKSEIEHDGSFRAGVIACITKMIDDPEIQDNIIEELNTYQDQQGTFGHEIAVRQRRNKNFNPAKWWLNHGRSTPKLRLLASKILNLTCSSSACERNWSVFE
uniref:HAT C-terminal dimerisation domain-containing protein n=1 Tax=Arundo donax TaxID=35708 RepID=A0A0A8ZWN9_ARUDO